jgi:DNA gyrase subunit B
MSKSDASQSFENEEIRNIFTALGVTIGTEEDSKALNISKLHTIKYV